MVASRTQSHVEKTTRLVFQTREKWHKWWLDHTKAGKQSDSPEARPPMVDFQKETILVATSGMRTTGGHAIQSTGIRRQGDTLIAAFSTRSPGPDGVATRALTHPFASIAIPKNEDPVEFEEM